MAVIVEKNLSLWISLAGPTFRPVLQPRTVPMKVTSGSSSAYSTKLISRTFQVHDVHSHWNYVYDFKALTLRGLYCIRVDQWKGHLWKSQIEMRIKKFSLWNAIRLHNSWNIGTEFTANSCMCVSTVTPECLSVRRHTEVSVDFPSIFQTPKLTDVLRKTCLL